MNTEKKRGAIPQYPLVLVHGIGFRDVEGENAYWGRVPGTLRREGIEVNFGYTDAWGDYESNGAILKAKIEEILDLTGKEKVNIIAHSKGGLDSRYLIGKYGFGGKVASLTTIATPHHGAEVADMVYGAGIIHTKPVQSALEVLGKIFGDSNPNIRRALAGLTTGYMKKFNEEVASDERVYYQSIYSTMDNAGDDLLFFYTHSYIQGLSGGNDGLVSEASALWGNNCRKLAGSLSHHDIIDMKMRSVRGIDIPAIYLGIVRDLAARGF